VCVAVRYTNNGGKFLKVPINKNMLVHPNRGLSLRHAGSSESATTVPVKRPLSLSVSVVVRLGYSTRNFAMISLSRFSLYKIYSQIYKHFSFMCKRF
jgi:hypothetical protein